MPKLSWFYGIAIIMRYNDHPPPHFHAEYRGAWAKIQIDDLKPVEGQLSGSEKRDVLRWASLHQEELREAWERRTRREPLGKIEPLG